MIVKIDQSGSIKFIWDDALIPLFNEGSGTIKRASHVEPSSDGKWSADLSPVGGPLLENFSQRKDALRAEVLWLEENIIECRS